MGEIVYYTTCGDRLLGSDFEKGRAVIIIKRQYCATRLAGFLHKGKSGQEGRFEPLYASRFQPGTVTVILGGDYPLS